MRSRDGVGVRIKLDKAVKELRNKIEEEKNTIERKRE